jgi:hypothetical protein
MGFMDKAKQLAEQAQQKLDEAQKNFNQSESPQAQPGERGVKYDDHGRPIQEAPPAGAAPPPSAQPPDPTTPSPPPDPAPETGPAGTERQPEAPEAPARASGDQANTSPDPFKPLQQ